MFIVFECIFHEAELNMQHNTTQHKATIVAMGRA